MIITDWFQKNRLVLNVDKTKYILFQNKQVEENVLENLQISYEQKNIERVKKYKYLGLIIDSKLKWDSHIDLVTSKIVPYIFTLRRIKNICHVKTMTMIYYSYIHSHFTYLNTIWSGCSNSDKSNQLFILQKRAIKYINNLPRLYPTILLFRNYKTVISLPVLAKIELVLIIHKIINNNIKHNFELSHVFDRHDYPTSRRSNLLVDFFATGMGSNNILYRGITTFNNLPKNIKYQRDFLKFKKEITEYFRN